MLKKIVVGLFIVFAVFAGCALAVPGKEGQKPHGSGEPTLRFVDEQGRLVSCDQVDRLYPEHKLRKRECATPTLTHEPMASLALAGPSQTHHVPVTSSSPGFPISGGGSNDDRVQVRGYTTKSGRYVEPHYRSRANDTTRDNWTTTGNRNPVTGSRGSRHTKY